MNRELFFLLFSTGQRREFWKIEYAHRNQYEKNAFPAKMKTRCGVTSDLI